MIFTEPEIDYMRSQHIGRLGTVGPTGSPQVRPVIFELFAVDGVIEIGGHGFGQSQKFRNVQKDGRVSLVVDDLASVERWQVRGVEIRGIAEPLTNHPPRHEGFSEEAIRIHPRRVVTWGIEPNPRSLVARDLA